MKLEKKRKSLLLRLYPRGLKAALVALMSCGAVLALSSNNLMASQPGNVSIQLPGEGNECDHECRQAIQAEKARRRQAAIEKAAKARRIAEEKQEMCDQGDVDSCCDVKFKDDNPEELWVKYNLRARACEDRIPRKDIDTAIRVSRFETVIQQKDDETSEEYKARINEKIDWMEYRGSKDWSYEVYRTKLMSKIYEQPEGEAKSYKYTLRNKNKKYVTRVDFRFLVYASRWVEVYKRKDRKYKCSLLGVITGGISFLFGSDYCIVHEWKSRDDEQELADWHRFGKARYTFQPEEE